MRAGADLRDASSSFSKAVYKTASIYTKLVDFDNSDFKQTMSYLDDEDKLYEKIYTFSNNLPYLCYL